MRGKSRRVCGVETRTMPSGCAAIQMQDSDRQTTRASSGSAASRHGPCHGCDTAPAWPTCDAVFALSSAPHAGTPSAHGDAARPGGLLRNRGVESLRVSPSLSESLRVSMRFRQHPFRVDAVARPGQPGSRACQPGHGPPPVSRAATRITGRHPGHGPPPLPLRTREAVRPRRVFP